MGRTCEQCGFRMPLFVPRQRANDGRLLCPGCHPDGRGSEGRPIGIHGAKTALRYKVTLEGARGKTFACFQVADSPIEARRLALERYPDTQVLFAEDTGPQGDGYHIVEFDEAGSIVRESSRGYGTLEEALGMVEEAGFDVTGAPKVAAYEMTPERDLRGCPDCRALPGTPHTESCGWWDSHTSDDQENRLWEAGLPRGQGVKLAHDSGDGKTIYHCPFCGAGQVIARSDGTVECDFCHTSFTVQVQPERPSMPQTIDGQPFPIPGMPGDPTDRGVPQEAPVPGDAPAFTPPDRGDAFVPPAQDQIPQQAASLVVRLPPDPSQRVKFSIAPRQAFYITKDGVVLPEDSFVRHLAINFADDREAVLEQVKVERAR